MTLFLAADPHPGNIAVDGENGGRLIYYDFGMMGAIPSDVRSGLLELFYGVYEKDPDRSALQWRVCLFGLSSYVRHPFSYTRLDPVYVFKRAVSDDMSLA